MAYDLLIKNGTVVDGSGRTRYRADLAAADGRIVDIGELDGPAKEVIDACDLIVAPGFIDPHTHYDAQICWDPLVSCSSWHGVTSVVMGNCGVGIAPCRPETREIASRDLVSVEGIPLQALSEGITWDWVSFPEYMNAAQQRGIGINLGFLAPLTPFRHFVMGEESMEREATPQERASVGGLLREAISAGALGFSTTIFRQHIGYKGRPLACRLASRDELAAYAGVLREMGKGVIEIALTQDPGILTEEEFDLLEFLVDHSGRKVTWTALIPHLRDPHAHEESLRKAEPLIRRGAIPQVLCTSNSVQFSLRDPFIFASRAEWRQAFHRTVEEQKQLYADPAFRQAFREGLKKPEVFFSGDFTRMAVMEAGHQALKALEGKTIDQIAREAGKEPADALLDVAIQDDIATRFALLEGSERQLAGLLTDERTMIALGDGGAHVDMFCGAAYCTHLLGTWVRQRGLLSLEHAVKRITSEPADFFGLTDRGRLATGMAADITIFDYTTVGEAGPAKSRHDLPGGGLRLVIPAQGIQYTIVNGRILFENGESREVLPGQVLRPA